MEKIKRGLLVCTVLFVLDIKFHERIFKLHMFLCWLAFATNKILPMAGMVFVEVIPGRKLMLVEVHLKEPFHHKLLGGVWYTGIGSGNRIPTPFLPYSYVWIKVKKVEMK